MKRLLITGSSGFIGRYFICNYSQKYRITELDLLKREVQTFSFHNIDSVLHLAALVHQIEGINEAEYYKVNRDLAFEVAKEAKHQGIKQFILMSTAKVYGESTVNSSLNESSECHPVDPYGKSKLEAEQLLYDLEDEKFKIAVIRSPLVYGPGVKANMLNLIKIVDKFPLLPLKGIENKRSLVYVGNLSALIDQIITTSASGIFIAGDRQRLSTTQLVKCIADALNKKQLLFRPPLFALVLLQRFKPALFVRLWDSLELDNQSTNRKLSFTPPYSTEDGIKSTVDWYLNSNIRH